MEFEPPQAGGFVTQKLGSPLGGWRANNQAEDGEKEGFTITCSK